MLLLSRNDAYQYLNKFIVAEITTTVRGIPVEVQLGRHEGLPSASVANLDNVRTVARPWLVSRVGALPPVPAPRCEAGARLRPRMGRID